MDLIEKAAEALEARQHPSKAPTSSDTVAPSSDGVPTEGHTRNYFQFDHAQLKKQGMIVPDNTRSLIKEEFRQIKRPLLQNIAKTGEMQPQYPNLIMVTSALPGEGKSFNAINLALSIAAERDKTVLLVDADVIKPSVERYIGMHAEIGLIDYLERDNLELSQVLVKTDLDNLSILPAGNSHPFSAELLACEAMKELMQEFATRYSDRVVIFDSPPLLSTSEASILADMMGQIVLVVSAGTTTQEEVKQALDRLPDNEHIAIGTVLNKSSYSQTGSYYGYYGSTKK